MIVLERAGKAHLLRDVSVHREGDLHRVHFQGKNASVLFELKRSRLGGYSWGNVEIRHGRDIFTRKLGRIELEVLRRKLLDGEEHLIVVGDVLLRLKPPVLSYLFPRDSYRRLIRFLFGLWELGRKIRELGRSKR
ncbi:MAG: hypothetical protein GXO00_02305 [Candidatus Diapherotrites archaeon]|nr:hypothetical protein [Candidatus Diapherotrites archaeon]